MSAEDVVGPVERRAGAGRNGLLADAKMDRAAHLLLGIKLGDPLFNPPDAEHELVQPQAQRGIGHRPAVALPLRLTCCISLMLWYSGLTRGSSNFPSRYAAAMLRTASSIVFRGRNPSVFAIRSEFTW